MGSKLLLVKAFDAEGAIGAYHIAKVGSADYGVLIASANSDNLVGSLGNVEAEASGKAEIGLVGIGEVLLGGNVARGEFITADSSGHGVKLTDTMLESGALHTIGRALISGVSGDIIPYIIGPQKVSKFDAVTASAAELNTLDGIAATMTYGELNILDGVTATAAEINLLDDQVAGATIVVGADAGTTAAVTIQLTKAAGTDMAARSNIKAYLSDDANGDSIVATAPSGGIAIGTDGLLIPIVANKAFLLTSESDGDIDLVVTEAGTKTLYLVLVMPNGKLVVSGAITFAA